MANEQPVGLVLSGGGIRALIYHLGVLKWCAERSIWNRIAHVSTVSGGSWCIGCVIGHSGGRWPTGEEYLSKTLPAVRETLTQSSMLAQLVFEGLTHPVQLVRNRAKLLSGFFTKHWNVTLDVRELPSTPVFHINATTFETGKRWAFTREKMGDYLFGYAFDPRHPVSDAIAASSGFPLAAGPMKLDTRPFRWQNGPYERGRGEPMRRSSPILHLWDGGIYENTGLEPLYKKGALRHGILFLIVADAAEPFGVQQWSWVVPRLMRLLFIALDQVRSIRARQVVSTFAECKNGFYAKIGKTPVQHLRDLSVDLEIWFPNALTEEECSELSKFSIWPKKVTSEQFDKMVMHGVQTCETIYGALFERGGALRLEYANDPVNLSTGD